MKWPAPDSGTSLRSEVNGVPFYPQAEYQCGPAALAMALGWGGTRVDLVELSSQVYTPSLKGSLQPALVTGARRNGRLAYTISGVDALIHEINAGHPVIVLQNLGLSWYPVWHYAVVTGYDLNARIIRLHSGVTAGKEMPLDTYQHTWERGETWGLLVLPPSTLPATAEETVFIDAVIGLERAGKPRAAAAAYRAALGQWPGNKSARIGLGNSCYAAGDLQCAETAFREASRQFPDDGVAFNNLANVLLAMGKTDAALDAARQAVSIGGPLRAVFLETLREIEAAISSPQ